MHPRCRANPVLQRGSFCRLALWLMPIPVSHHEPFVHRLDLDELKWAGICIPWRVLGPLAQCGPCGLASCTGTNKARLTVHPRCRANPVLQRGSFCRLALWLMPNPVSHHEPFVDRTDLDGVCWHVIPLLCVYLSHLHSVGRVGWQVALAQIERG